MNDKHLADAITTSQVNACNVQTLANGHSIRLQHCYQLNESTYTFSLFIHIHRIIHVMIALYFGYFILSATNYRPLSLIH